jgi:hypothetical protein
MTLNVNSPKETKGTAGGGRGYYSSIDDFGDI